MQFKAATDKTVTTKLLFILVLLFVAASGWVSARADKPMLETTSAIEALHQHITGEEELEGEQITAFQEEIDERKEWIGADPALIEAAFDLVTAYEREIGPLWIAYQGLNNRNREPGDEIHWAIFWVMQHIMDEVYTKENISRFESLLDGFRFGSADHFPGKVEWPEDAGDVYTVKIDGSYPETWGSPVFHEDRPARKPTGAYLAPGAIATLTVPDSLVEKGYQVRVGAHSWDLSSKPRVTRLYRCTTLYDITDAEVKVANPLGGGIYIEVPYRADAGIVEIGIENAARSPYFSYKSFHKTTLEEWREVERNHKAPWADFQSERFMMQVPTSWIYKLDDPKSLMQEWDKSVKVTDKLMGYPERHGREAIYTQVDTQLRGRAYHPGYPAVNRGYNPTRDYGGYFRAHHLISGPRNAMDYEFHELGHAYLFPKYIGDQEAAVNLPHVAVMNRAFDVELNEAFRDSRGQENEFQTLDTTAITWMMSFHFIEDGFMRGVERQYQLKGHAKFVDIVRLFGWKVLDDFWLSTNQDYEDGNPWPRNVSDTDEYTIRLSKQAGLDLRPLIHFWGIPTADDEKSDAAVEAAGLRPSSRIYHLLRKYKSLVPANNEAFREFALNWWQKQPSPEGHTTERNHAARWESYDEEEADRVRHTVQDVIERYFPQPMTD